MPRIEPGFNGSSSADLTALPKFSERRCKILPYLKLSLWSERSPERPDQRFQSQSLKSKYFTRGSLKEAWRLKWAVLFVSIPRICAFAWVHKSGSFPKKICQSKKETLLNTWFACFLFNFCKDIAPHDYLTIVRKIWSVRGEAFRIWFAVLEGLWIDFKLVFVCFQKPFKEILEISVE